MPVTIRLSLQNDKVKKGHNSDKIFPRLTFEETIELILRLWGLTFANRLDPDQARQNVRPDLGPNCSTR